MRFRQGTVVSVQGDGTITATIAGSTISVNGIKCFASVTPAVGHGVWLATDGCDLIAVGVIGPYPALSFAQAVLAANVTMANTGQWYAGPALALAAGTWLVCGQAQFKRAGGQPTRRARIWDGSTTYLAGETNALYAYNPSIAQIALAPLPVALAAAATLTLQGITDTANDALYRTRTPARGRLPTSPPCESPEKGRRHDRRALRSRTPAPCPSSLPSRSGCSTSWPSAPPTRWSIG